MLFCIREHSQNPTWAHSGSGILAPGEFWPSPSGCRAATTVYKMSLAAPLVRGWCLQPQQVPMGLLALEHTAYSKPWAIFSNSPSPPEGWKPPGRCLNRLLLALFELLFAFILWSLFHYVALPWFHSSLHTHLFLFSFVFPVLLVSSLQINMCSPPSQHQPPSPASGTAPLLAPHASTLPTPLAAPDLPGKSSLECLWRDREPLQLLHRHSASELLTTLGSSPPSCPALRTVLPRVRRASLSPPPSHPSSHFLFASCQPLRRSSLCGSQPSAAPITNTSLGQRADGLQPRGPTLLPVIPSPCDSVRGPTDKAGQETFPNVPLNGHPEAVGSSRSRRRSVVGAFLLRLGAAPASQLPAIASPPGSWGQTPSLSSLPHHPPQHCYQPISHCLPLPPPYAAGPEVTMPRRTLPYMTSSAISHLRKY